MTARLGFTLALLLVVSSQAAAQSPTERGRALQARLAKGALSDLVGEAELSGQLVPGGGRTFVLQTKTQLVNSKEGVPLYRIRDRLRVDLGGLGTARLRVEGDLRLDFSPERLLLVSEEPRGRGLIVETRIELRRTAKGWTRSVSIGQAAPKLTSLERPSLALTPPLGVGLRLARVAEAELGRRYSLPALDLETGLATRWRLSVDDELQLVLASQEGPARPVAGAVLTWREGGASLIGWRPKRSTSGLVRLAARATGPPGSKPRLEVRSERLQTTRPLGSSPEAAAAAFLRALARRDRAALAALLDVGALQKAARKRAGLEGPIGREEAARFKRVALARLSEEAWLEERGLRQGFASARPGDFASDPLEGDRARVKLKAHPKLVFELAKTNDAWRITALPILTRKGR